MSAPIDSPAVTDAAPAPKKRRSLRRRLAIIGVSILAGLCAIALVAAGLVVWTVHRSFPQLNGTVAVAGLGDEVTVYRDDLGVPSIVAGDTHDLFYAQGYVHAQARFWEMDFRRHVTSGRLSELFGRSQVATDRFLRTLGWRHVAEQEVAAMDATTRAHYDAYAEGVNAYLADHDGADLSLEYAVLGMQNGDYEIEPWTPADSVAWLKAMAWDLRSNVEEEVERAILAQTLTAEQIAELYPAYPYDTNPVIVPQIAAEAPPARGASVSWREAGSVIEAASALLGTLGPVGEGVGSNSWVVSGAHTESGLPLLSNDPHLGAGMPNIWHQVGLRCRTVTPDCPFDVAGFDFAGLPGVIIGHNGQIAWGFTNLTADVIDLYVEKIDGDRYWRDGELVPLQTRTETIEIAGGEPETLVVRSTVHGPIVSDVADGFAGIADDPFTGSKESATPAPDGPDGEEAVAMRWTALEAGTTAGSVFLLNTAQDFGQFRTAAAAFDVPAQNLVYADRDGNIGYQAPGKLPLRGAGDGSMPQPGWDSAYDWRGFIPFEELPVLYNPESGYIVTANNPPVGPPSLLGDDFDYGWRAARIQELLEQKIAAGKVTADDMTAIQADGHFWMGERLARAYADLAIDDEPTREAIALLQDWDGQNDADSAGAAYANVLWDELAMDLFTRRDDPAPIWDHGRMFVVVDRLLDEPDSPWWTNERLGVSGRDDMLRHAATEARGRLGQLQGQNPDAWKWGSLHTITLTSGTFGSSGIAPIEWLFNRGPYPVGGGTSVVNATGWTLGDDSFAINTVPSMRMTVDLADLDDSRWNQLTGVSGHAFHPNYVDQFEAWQQLRQTPWLFSLDRVRDAATHTLVLRP